MFLASLVSSMHPMSTAKVVRVLWPWSEASITLAPRKKRGADVAKNGKALPPPPRMTERSEESAFLSPLCPTSLSVSHFRNSVNVTDDDGVQNLSLITLVFAGAISPTYARTGH